MNDYTTWRIGLAAKIIVARIRLRNLRLRN